MIFIKRLGKVYLDFLIIYLIFILFAGIYMFIMKSVDVKLNSVIVREDFIPLIIVSGVYFLLPLFLTIIAHPKDRTIPDEDGSM